ncbi:hypothetical protein F3E67_20830 [Salmonella enterica subsp. salamae]|nr:hypothetical protein [Salmonella enterica subsp. salamae]
MAKSYRSQVIEQLSKRYPGAFKVTPHEVVPVIDGIELEIFNDIGRVPNDAKRHIYAAIAWYRTWPNYLYSVLTESGKVNLKGNVMASVTFSDKQKAREALIQRGLWTPRLAKLYKSKTGLMNATNEV